MKHVSKPGMGEEPDMGVDQAVGQNEWDPILG